MTNNNIKYRIKWYHYNNIPILNNSVCYHFHYLLEKKWEIFIDCRFNIPKPFF